MRFRYSAGSGGKPVRKAAVYTRDEHGIDFADVDGDAVRIVERLREAGHETYIVGGAVRDLILRKKPKDFDIASDASPTRIKKLFRNARIIGHRFRLVHVCAGEKIFEVATFRSLKDGPAANVFGTVEEDVLRRDFTLNALFYDPLRQVVVDYVGGMKDIRARRVRPILPLATIFTDDPVRMIRAVKYGAAAGFALPLMVRWKIRKQCGLLADVSPSRLTEEIFKIIHGTQARLIVDRLDAMGLYRYLQPNAVDRFAATPGFRARYLATLDTLNRPDTGFQNRPGEALAGLVRDYLEDTTDWAVEDPAAVFVRARAFVLPMNPPRVELDHAIRLLFEAHGVTVKRTARPPRRERPGPRREAAPAAAGGGEGGAPAAGAAREAAPVGAAGADGGETTPRKRRRRRRKPAATTRPAASPAGTAMAAAAAGLAAAGPAPAAPAGEG